MMRERLYIFWVLALLGCDKYDQVDCSNNGSTVLHSSGEFCMCDENTGWMYDYEQEKWRCLGAPGFESFDNSYSYAWTFNGIHMGPQNTHHILKFIFNKPDSSFRIAAKESVVLWSTGGVFYKRDNAKGDSIYMRDLLVRHPNRFEFILDGKDCLVTGRGRVSKNKDTLDMTAYIIPREAIVANENYRDARDIDVSVAADVRKMQFLSVRAFPKYAR